MSFQRFDVATWYFEEILLDLSTAMVDQVCENHHFVIWKETSVLDRARGQETYG